MYLAPIDSPVVVDRKGSLVCFHLWFDETRQKKSRGENAGSFILRQEI